MEFHVFQCQADRDYFVVTDDTHLDDTLNNPSVSPTPGDKLEKLASSMKWAKTGSPSTRASLYGRSKVRVSTDSTR